MSEQKTVSLTTAILINLNVMMGAGIFINTTALAQYAGAAGFIGYLVIGILMLPLIIAIAQLLHYYPSGGFYTFAANTLGARAGFLSCWTYFSAKLASATLMIHVSVTLLQSLIPAMQTYHSVLFDMIILCLFIILNTFNIRIGSIIQASFLLFKSIPLLSAIGIGTFLFKRSYFNAAQFNWDGIPSLLPFVLYSTVGFEAACSLSSHIKNAEKNAPRVVLISFGIVILIATFYQFFFYGALGPALASLPSYRYVFPSLLQSCLPNCTNILNFLHLAIACSALGGSYGIIFSNTWNLYTLAQHKHIPGYAYFTEKNNNLVPWLCVLTQGILCTLYLILTHGAQIPLQQISALGCTFAYAISIFSLYKRYINENAPWSSFLIVITALCSCTLLIAACLKSLYYQSSYALLTFLTLIVTGLSLFEISKKQHSSFSN